MKNITQATEKRIKKMVERGHKFGEALQSLLDDMKSRMGWYGASIKEMKKYGYELENETQVNVSRYYQPLYNGLGCIFSDIFTATFCLDLHYVSIKDFNELVKRVDAMEYDGYGTY